MNTILVTGASGYLGYHVIKLLNERGLKPRALLPCDTEEESTAVKELKKLDIDIVEGSVQDLSSLHAACEGVDTVLHLNFAIELGSGEEAQKALDEVNVIGTRNLLDAATKANVTRVVVSSSSLTVGLNRKPEPLDETAVWEAHRFDLAYAQSRRKAERDALARPDGSERPTIVVVNPSFTMGPDDYVGAPANKLVKKMVTGFRFSAPIGFGVLDVRDYADGVLRAAERGRHGRRYILSGENVKPGTLQKKVSAITGNRPPLFVFPIYRWMVYSILILYEMWCKLTEKPPKVPRSLLQLWGRHAWYDTSRAREELGWEPRPLQDTLKDIVRALPETKQKKGTKKSIAVFSLLALIAIWFAAAAPRPEIVLFVLGLVVLIAIWWVATAPRPEIGCYIAKSIVIDASTAKAVAAVDHSQEFAVDLEQLETELPPYDDAVFVDGGNTMLVTAHDGKIWSVDLGNNAAKPLVDAPMMAWGIHASPNDPNQVYLCCSGSYGERPPGDSPGIYSLALDSCTVEPIVLRVPVTQIDHENPIVYSDADPNAPEVHVGDDGSSREIAVCDNLEVSEDGNRIYFSEPFSYTGASVNDAVDEAIALARNGRLWRHDLKTGVTRLIAQGFHFINGILYDPHPGQAREESVIVTQTTLFRLTRFYLRGPKAGSSEVVIDGLPGTPDGMDRDNAGRIWLAMFIDRGKLLTWLHKNAWLKPFFMRLPSRLLLSQNRRTGVLVVSPDGSKPLYSAFHKGAELSSIASAVPSPSGIYLANVSLGDPIPDRKSIQRLKWPPQFLMTPSEQTHEKGR